MLNRAIKFLIFLLFLELCEIAIGQCFYAVSHSGLWAAGRYNRVKSHNQGVKKGEYRIHRVRRGENLHKISDKYHVSIDELCRINRIKRDEGLDYGMLLKIPNNGTSKHGEEAFKSGSRPYFQWPLRKVIHIKRDGRDGVKSIGIIITGRGGSAVYSSASGRVKKIGWMRGFGKYVILKHEGRYITVYANMDRVFVKEGDSVEKGHMIGRIDEHDNRLHFQINCAGKTRDPLNLLPKKS